MQSYVYIHAPCSLQFGDWGSCCSFRIVDLQVFLLFRFKFTICLGGMKCMEIYYMLERIIIAIIAFHYRVHDVIYIIISKKKETVWYTLWATTWKLNNRLIILILILINSFPSQYSEQSLLGFMLWLCLSPQTQTFAASVIQKWKVYMTSSHIDSKLVKIVTTQLMSSWLYSEQVRGNSQATMASKPRLL